MDETDPQARIARWRELWSAPRRGWDFSDLDGRIIQQRPPWSYPALAGAAVAGARSVLDVGTGGGESLLALAGLPPDTHATEGWAPNVDVARAVLGSRGIRVAQYDAHSDDVLPYPDARFDVVLSRHAAYDVREVARVLRPGGTLVTQQVDARNLADLSTLFGAVTPWPEVTLDTLRHDAEHAGLTVQRAETWTGTVRFADVDTLVSYLRRVPWHLPADFAVDRYAGPLLALDRANRPLTFTQGRVLLVARRS